MHQQTQDDTTMSSHQDAPRTAQGDSRDDFQYLEENDALENLVPLPPQQVLEDNIKIGAKSSKILLPEIIIPCNSGDDAPLPLHQMENVIEDTGKESNLNPDSNLDSNPDSNHSSIPDANPDANPDSNPDSSCRNNQFEGPSNPNSGPPVPDPPPVNFQGGGELPLTAEATLVRDPPVAEAVAESWLQRRRLLIVAIVLLMAVAAVTVAVVVTLVLADNNQSSNNQSSNNNGFLASSEPPSLEPTTTPTNVPTWSPTSEAGDCFLFQNHTTLHTDSFAHMAVDGTFAVLTHNASAHFFSLTNSGSWKAASSVPAGTSYYLPIALSGTVAVAGAHQEDAAYIFHQEPAGTWSQLQRIAPENIAPGAKFGSSVSIDGDLIAIGAQDDGVGKVGSVRLYHRVEIAANESSWTLQTAVFPDNPNHKLFGFLVKVKRDLLIVSDVQYGPSREGAVFLYRHDPVEKSLQLVQTIFNLDCDGLFGGGLAIAKTGGEDIMIGCPFENNQIGAVYHYTSTIPGGQFSFQQKIVPSDGGLSGGQVRDWFGGSDQIALEGNILLVGASNHDYGRLYVFARKNHTFTEVAKLTAPQGSGSDFGDQVSISKNKLLVASFTEVYSYTLNKCHDENS